jgi:hypothetical protein
MSNYYVSTGSALVVRSLDSCYFGNCIIDGNISEEIGIDSTTAVGYGYFNYKFDHCIVKTARSTSSNPHYISLIPNGNLDFYDISNNDYRILSVSVAANVGDSGIASGFPRDLNNNLRPDPSDSACPSCPDLGAYER